MDERRSTIQLINRWKKVKLESPLPIIESFEIQYIKNEMLNSMVIFANDIKYNNKDYHIEFMGSNIIDLTRSINQQSQSPLNKAMQKLPIISNIPVLVTDKGVFADNKSNIHKYRSCLLPFGYNKNIVTHFIMYISHS